MKLARLRIENFRRLGSAAKPFEGDSVACDCPWLQHRADVLRVEEVDQLANCYRGAPLYLLLRRVAA